MMILLLKGFHETGRTALLLLLLLLSIPFLDVNSQEGEPFMNHIKPENVSVAKITSITEDIENTMVFAGNSGVITFDSEDWQHLQVPNIPMVVSADSILPMIYVGGRGFYGYLLKSGDGTYEYHDLGEEEVESGDISRIYQTEQHIIYYGKDMIAMADRKILYNASRYRADSITDFAGMFIFEDKIYVNILEVGLHELADRQANRIKSSIDFSDSEILFWLEYGKEIIIGTSKNRLYRFNGRTFRSINLGDQEYLSESSLKGAVWLEEDNLALSTILGGCLIVNVKNGRTLNILNLLTGLPDDEIFAITKDQNKGLWIAHQYGLTRVDVSLPVRSYENYPGLSGNLTAVAMLNNTLYVSTNEGVFYLKEKKDYVVTTEERIEKFETPSPLQLKVEEPNVGEELATQPIQTELSPREIRRQRRQARRDSLESAQDSLSEGLASENEDAVEDPESGSPLPVDKEAQQDKTSGEGITMVPPRTRIRSIKDNLRQLQSISHDYTRLGRFEEKVKDLVPIGNRIIIASNGGLYEVVNKQMKSIQEDWYIERIITSNDPSMMYVVTDETVYSMKLLNNAWIIEKDFSHIQQEIYSICEEGDSAIWLGCDNRSYRIISVADSLPHIDTIEFHEDYHDPVFLRNIHDTVFFFLSSGIYFFKDDSLQKTTYIRSNDIPQYFFSDGSISWGNTGHNWISLVNHENYNKHIDSFLNLFENITDLYLDPTGNTWVVNEDHYLYKIIGAEVDQYHPGFQLFLKSVHDNNGSYPLDELLFDYLDRSLVFNFSAPFYLKDHSTSYQYWVEGMSAGWSGWDNSPELSFPVLPVGTFILHVKAMNILGQSSTLKSFPIVIKPPWWLSWMFIILVGLIVILVVIQIIRMRVRKLQRDKQMLEQKVLERTAEIQRQKDEIAEQKKEIMDSIYYARRIQKAVLPDDHLVNKNMPEHFVLYLPRDIVSGDFYWIAEKEDNTIFAAADCTGHGVPGAFMSMLGMSYLKEIVNKSKRLSSARILDRLRDHVKATLSQSTKGGQQDGMDIALCILKKNRRSLQYSGAFHPLYLIRNGNLSEYKPDLMPIGIYIRKEKPFKNHNIRTAKGDCYYIFSDGYADQFGGENRKKFLARSFKKLLLSIHDKPMAEQREILLETLKQWMDGYEQVDDILVIGFRI